MTTRRAPGLSTVTLLAILASLNGWTAAGEPESQAPQPDDATYTESVTVTADRLPDAPLPVERIPAHVTVIDREAIERSGARTLQDLLSTQAGVVLYDQVGNDIEKTLDLRGFSGGSATRVYLDGVPLNDPRNNALALDLVPIDALERVEITRGAGVAVSGGGSSAGAIHLTTRRSGEPGGSLTVAAGSDDTSRLGGDVQGSVGRVGYYLSTVRSTGDGFRENSGGDVHRSAANLDVDLGPSRRLALSLIDARSNLGNPGALTADEMAQNAAATPFNSLDFSDERSDLQAAPAAGFHAELAGAGLIDRGAHDADADLAVGGDRIACVDHEVHHHLLELTPVGIDLDPLAGKLNEQFPVVPEQALQESRPCARRPHSGRVGNGTRCPAPRRSAAVRRCAARAPRCREWQRGGACRDVRPTRPPPCRGSPSAGC